MMSTGLLLTKQVACRLGLSPDRVRQLEREGRLPAHKTAGGVRLFELETVERFAVERKRKAGAGDEAR
jgi:excisionase family DNA binding protein